MDSQAVNSLIDKFTCSNLTSLKYHDSNFDLELTQASKEATANAQSATSSAPIPIQTIAVPESAAASASTSTSAEPVDETALITAPVVGIFYIAPTSTEAPYVSAGDTVTAGQQVGIVQAMQVMRPVVAKQSGVVTELLVQNGTEVSYGQPLMKFKATSDAQD